MHTCASINSTKNVKSGINRMTSNDVSVLNSVSLFIRILTTEAVLNAACILSLCLKG